MSNRMNAGQRRQRGFSLIELGVALLVAGMLGLVVWKLLPLSRQVAEGDAAKARLAEAGAALEGYALRAYRLPCPDADNDGREDCAAASIGGLPWRDLGLGTNHAGLRYGVYRSGSNDLAAATSRFEPLLPLATSTVINGLDLCLALRNAAAAPLGLTAGTVPAAWAVADAGANSVFEGLNTTAFDLPNRAASDSYDDRVSAAGLGELSGRLGCPVRLGEAQAAARAAYAAYDIQRGAILFKDFRAFAYEIRKTNTRFAITTEAIAILDMLNAVGTATSSVSIAINSAGAGTFTIPAAVATIGAGALALAVATGQVALAAVNETKAGAQSEDATTFATSASTEFANSLSEALAQDNKGLTP